MQLVFNTNAIDHITVTDDCLDDNNTANNYLVLVMKNGHHIFIDYEFCIYVYPNGDLVIEC